MTADPIDTVRMGFMGVGMRSRSAVYAMEHGKHVAVEVPAAMSIKECWQLVNTCEKTRCHCMMLENCVYDFFEMTALNMAQHGLFGEIVHAEGGHIHNLDPQGVTSTPPTT